MSSDTTAVQKAASFNHLTPFGKPAEASQYFRHYEATIAKSLVKWITPERFVSALLNEMQKNPKLYDCTKISVLSSVSQAATLGLEIGATLGQCFLIPRYNSKIKATECTIQIGYKGLISLAMRSPVVQSIDAQNVHENDYFDLDLGSQTIKHKVDFRQPRGKHIATYAQVFFTNGGKIIEVMSFDELMAHKENFAQTTWKDGKPNDSPWNHPTNYLEMCKKTLVRKVCKKVPMSPELQSAVTFDESGEMGQAQSLRQPVQIEDEKFSSDFPEPDFTDDAPPVETDEFGEVIPPPTVPAGKKGGTK